MSFSAYLMLNHHPSMDKNPSIMAKMARLILKYSLFLAKMFCLDVLMKWLLKCLSMWASNTVVRVKLLAAETQGM